MFNPPTPFEFVSGGSEALNLRLHLLPFPATNMTQERRVLLLDHVPSASVVGHDKAALMGSIDEVTVQEH